MKRYAIVLEKAESNYAAYVPDLPGCVATGRTIEETERRLKSAIDLHVQGLHEDGLPVPSPQAWSITLTSRLDAPCRTERSRSQAPS
jgi:predicted RNase H-like HicB family nuclease